MAKITEIEDRITIDAAAGSDVQSITISRQQAQDVLDVLVEADRFASELVTALDEVQGAASEGYPAVLVLIVKD